MAEEIQRCRASGVPYRQMAVLFRVRTIGEPWRGNLQSSSVQMYFCHAEVRFSVALVALFAIKTSQVSRGIPRGHAVPELDDDCMQAALFSWSFRSERFRLSTPRPSGRGEVPLLPSFYNKITTPCAQPHFSLVMLLFLTN